MSFHSQERTALNIPLSMVSSRRLPIIWAASTVSLRRDGQSPGFHQWWSKLSSFPFGNHLYPVTSGDILSEYRYPLALPDAQAHLSEALHLFCPTLPCSSPGWYILPILYGKYAISQYIGWLLSMQILYTVGSGYWIFCVIYLDQQGYHLQNPKHELRSSHSYPKGLWKGNGCP